MPRAAELDRRITAQEKAEWQMGSIEDWVMDGHRLGRDVSWHGHPFGKLRAGFGHDLTRAGRPCHFQMTPLLGCQEKLTINSGAGRNIRFVGREAHVQIRSEVYLGSD